MRKRFTKNANLAIETLKSINKTKKLTSIDAKLFIYALLKQKGSFGKTILESTLPQKLLSSYKNKKDLNLVLKKGALSAQELLNKATKAAYLSKSHFVGTEHLANEVLDIPEISPHVITQKVKISAKKDDEVIAENSFDKNASSQNDFLGELNSIIENFFQPGGTQGKKRQAGSNNFCTDLTANAQEDHILIGRDYELERISHILGRKMKNNPVLIGDPGVGKTAIVEGLAKKIKEGKAEYYLCGKKILSLDLGLLVAGTTFRGEFEARLKDIVNQIKKNPNIILFIDEIHNLVGAGNATGGMDAANLLKPILSRGEIQLIGATTIEEYRKHIEKDAALERRLQPIMVEEPSVIETKQILDGIKKSYEKFHNVTISDDANLAAATLAKRYITERNLPDSAIDLIDETAARLRSGASDNSIYRKIKAVEEKLSKIKLEKETLVIGDRYEEAIRMRSEENKVSRLLNKLRAEQKLQESKQKVLVSASEIQKTLSKIARIPNEALSQDSTQLVRRVRNQLNQDLVGQPQVKKHVGNTILRQVSGIANPNRPLGSFLFVGPSGVGKTHCAKLLAKAISPQDQGNALIQINMSEFMEKHTVSRLLGAPAGYVGYEESGEFADKVRRNPYSVILFDEIEKADPAVLNILLQILEEGEVSDAKGRAINFRNAVVILTSNVGMEELNKASQLGFDKKPQDKKSKYEEITSFVIEQIEEILSPEMLSRLDQVLHFRTLTKKSIDSIVLKELSSLSKRLRARAIESEFDKSVIELISKKSRNSGLGAREVRKHIQDIVEPAIAQKLLSNKNIAKISLSSENEKIKTELVKTK